MTETQCGVRECSNPATRQQYADTTAEAFTADPWAADQYDPRCAEHAGPDSWPIVPSLPSGPMSPDLAD